MSDEKLRELERRFRETGSAEDEVAWLRERARSGEKLDWESYSRLHELDVDAAADYLRWRVATGDLAQERLELAAFCEFPGARLAAPEAETPPELLGQLFESIERSWGRRAVVGAAVAAAQAALDSCMRSGHSKEALPVALVEAANLAFRCPSRAHSEAAWAAYRSFSGGFWRGTAGEDTSLQSAQSAALACARAAAGRHHAARKALDEAAAAAGTQSVRAAVLRYLLTWALSSDSPI
ncbi:MAG: hypothetical protein AB7N76_28955 [Planctomycetota bacterium]